MPPKLHLPLGCVFSSLTLGQVRVQVGAEVGAQAKTLNINSTKTIIKIKGKTKIALSQNSPPAKLIQSNFDFI